MSSTNRTNSKRKLPHSTSKQVPPATDAETGLSVTNPLTLDDPNKVQKLWAPYIPIVKVFVQSYLNAKNKIFQYHSQSLEAVKLVTSAVPDLAENYQLMELLSCYECKVQKVSRSCPFGVKISLGKKLNAKSLLHSTEVERAIDRIAKSVCTLSRGVMSGRKKVSEKAIVMQVISELEHRTVMYQIVSLLYGVVHKNIFHRNIKSLHKQTYWKISSQLTWKFDRKCQQYTELLCRLCLRFKSVAAIDGEAALLEQVFLHPDDPIHIQKLRDLAITQSLDKEATSRAIVNCFRGIIVSKPKAKFDIDCYNSSQRSHDLALHLWWNCIRGKAFILYMHQHRDVKKHVEHIIANESPADSSNTPPTQTRERRSASALRSSHLGPATPIGGHPSGETHDACFHTFSLPRNPFCISYSNSVDSPYTPTAKKRMPSQGDDGPDSSVTKKLRVYCVTPPTTSLPKSPPIHVFQNHQDCPRNPDLDLLGVDDDRLKQLRIATPKDIKRCCYSDLTVLKPCSNAALHCEQSPVDVYLAYPLFDLDHKRVVKHVIEPGVYESPKVVGMTNVYVDSEQPDYIDTAYNTLHVTRQLDGEVFQQMGGNMLKMSIGALFRGLVKKGKGCEVRSPESYRLNQGLGANFSYNVEMKRPHYVGFNDFLEVFGMGEEGDRVRTEVAQIGEFVWKCAQEFLKRAGQSPMGGDKLRKELSDELKRQLLGAHGDYTFEWEFITIALMEIYPRIPINNYHKDVLNPREKAYCQTGAFNMVVKDPTSGTLYLLQFLFNFRESASDYVKRESHKRK